MAVHGLSGHVRMQRAGDMVRRIDCLDAIYADLADCAVITIMGAVAAELYCLGHRANFFYLEHAMGLASSVGLGVATAQPDRRVVVLDGDGSMLMNLGGLTTLARYAPPNLTHIIFDNESLLSVGGFPTATATGADLAGIAAAAGVANATTVHEVATFAETVRTALEDDGLWSITAKVDETGPPLFSIDVHMLENRFAFARALAHTGSSFPEQEVGS